MIPMTNPADHLLLKLSKNHGWGEPHKSFEIDEQTKTIKEMINLGMLPEEYLPKPEIIYSSDTCNFLFPEKIDDWPDNLFDLLGLYEIPDPNKEGRIILYEEYIDKLGLIYYNMLGKFFSQTRPYCINMIREIVIWHELGHWITHWMLGSDGYRWEYSRFIKGLVNTNLHEGLAQLFAYYAILNIEEKEKKSNYLLMFDFMLRKQALCYHKHIDIINHKNFSWTGILKALTVLRIVEDVRNITLEYLLSNLPRNY